MATRRVDATRSPSMLDDDVNEAERYSASAEIANWSTGYVRRHPGQSFVTVGEQIKLAVESFRYLFSDLIRGRFPLEAFIRESVFMANTALLPTFFVAIPIGVTLAIQFSLLAGQVGATSLAGAASGLAVIRQGAPLVTALMMAAAVGSAICADLGSRTIREEIDAMRVMGVSPIRRLVVPRLAAAMVVGTALTGIVTFVGFLAGYLFNVYVQDGAPGSFVATFASFATVGDMVLTLVKALVFGMIVAIVACQKGLSTVGGPAAVANSVNSTVVGSIMLLMLVNVLFTQMYVMVFPRASF